MNIYELICKGCSMDDEYSKVPKMGNSDFDKINRKGGLQKNQTGTVPSLPRYIVN